MGFPSGSVVKNFLPCRRLGLDPWVRKVLWRSILASLTPVFFPGKSHGQRSLVGYSLWGSKRVGHDLATERQQQLFIEGCIVSTLELLQTKKLDICMQLWIYAFLGMKWLGDFMHISIFSITCTFMKSCISLHPRQHCTRILVPPHPHQQLI